MLVIRQGASLALNAGRWLECLVQISAFHNLPSPTEFERLPVGTGSNPVSSAILSWFSKIYMSICGNIDML